ncbi:MAG: hypothetical protein ACYDAQ_03260 [Mycobacteriales bacterium]
MDYHLSWLHAALTWRAGMVRPAQERNFPLIESDTVALVDEPTVSAWVTGTQQDGDLILCWQDAGTPRVLIVEAKGYGAWNNAHAASKVERLTAIADQAKAMGSDAQVKLVLTSPRPPQHLKSESWPPFAQPADGAGPPWMPLPVPRNRLTTQRCDSSGKSSAAGKYWHITGP